MHFPDFNLSGGCFGTDIIQNCTKLSNIVVPELMFGPIFAKFHCAFVMTTSSAQVEVCYRTISLQLKRGLFWYRHYPKMHEMVSDRSSRADFWLIFVKFKCGSFLIRINVEKWQYGRQKTQTCRFLSNKSLRSYTDHTKIV